MNCFETQIEKENILNINTYLNDSIQRVAATVLQASAKNLKELRFVTSIIPTLRGSENRRKEFEKKGTHIPPFLIASITSQCNLRCAGCYARASGACSDTMNNNELTAREWQYILTQASELGVSFILLAGGEPLMRKDIIEAAAGQPDVIFPVFTNGTRLDDDYLLLFDQNRHLIPVISMEGDSGITDARRGAGVSLQIDSAMDALKCKGILYGASITVTSNNMELVTSEEFIFGLRKKGCGIIFFVEYVPAQPGSEWLVLDEIQRQEQEERIKALKRLYKNMVLIAFPGDEKYMGGCLAAGRGFFHINATGGAEPCPFSPFSDVNLRTQSLLQALSSSLFKKLRETDILELPHTGGCALFDKQESVKTLIGE